MTIREIIYMCLDQARLVTDDITLNEEHALFLANKIRAYLLIQKYKTVKLEVQDGNYQVLCIDLQEHNTGSTCDGEIFVRSTTKVPNLLKIGNDLVTPYNYIKGVNISLVPAERMRYVGHNKHLRNIIYATIGHDGYLYMKSHNPQFKYMNRAKLTGVFEDVVAASYMVCDHELNLWDRVFAIEDALVNPLVEAVVKEMVGAEYRPKDNRNNANDSPDKIIAQNKQQQ